MKILRLLLLPLLLFTLLIETHAQGVRIYKTDGTTIDIAHFELDSIVSMVSGQYERVHRNDGRVFKVLFNELDSIVAFGGEETMSDFVDMGLSVMWAKRNIGAGKAEDSGLYFAWGETSTKQTYTKENSLTTGKAMNIITSTEYDAATANWGEGSRIPTYEEFQELREKCNWEWTTYNGVEGQLVTGPSGNSIFLPAAGVFSGDSVNSKGTNGAYWSATPYEGDNVNAFTTIFNSYGFWGSMRLRSDGLSVRAVLGKVQCLSYTGDTLTVGEHAADVSVMFRFVPAEGVVGGIEYYSTSDHVKHRKTMDVTKDGEYVITLDKLERGTKYKYRSFVIVDEKYVYGMTEEFITKNNDDNLTKGEWIDLGLSIKWASHNIGAAKPEDYGDYYAWGEIYPKQLYDEDNCETSGKDLSDISGNSDYDAATATWGGDARMPTQAEIDELIEKCTWEWLPRNGVNGMLVTGPNGNTIFLPASGFRVGAVLDADDKNGFYWSSTPKDDDKRRAFGFTFSKKSARTNWSVRGNGRVVRPVSD